ncbi:MAG: MinD/ParA family protein, partial [Haloglomus sp.]
MVGDVYTIAGGKGGVGKTTTAMNAGVALQEAGHETLIVDADLGMTNLGAVLGIDGEPLLHDVLAGEADPADATVDGPSGVDILVDEGSLEAFAKAEPTNLRPLLEHLAEEYEFVLVDTGAGISHETIEPMKASDGIVLVTTPDEVAIRDARKIGELGDRVETGVAGVVVTRATADTRVEVVEEKVGADVLAVVPEDQTATSDEPLVV